MKNKKRRLSSLFPDPANDPKIKAALATFRKTFDNSKGNRVARFRDRLAVRLADWKANALTREIGRVAKATGLRRQIVEEVYLETPREECQNRCVEMARNRKENRSIFEPTRSEKTARRLQAVSHSVPLAGKSLAALNRDVSGLRASVSRLRISGETYARIASLAPEWCKDLARETVFPLQFVVKVAEEWEFDEESTRAAIRAAVEGHAYSRRDLTRRSVQYFEQLVRAQGTEWNETDFAERVEKFPFFGKLELSPRLHPSLARLALTSSAQDLGNFVALPGSNDFIFTTPKR